MRQEGYRTYKSSIDANLKFLSEQRVKKIKAQRAKLRKAKALTLEKAKGSRTTKRNINTLTKSQQKRFQKKYKKLEKVSKKLKYKQNGGAIGFEKVLTDGNWTKNFVSSNVRAFRVRGSNLLVQFHDGSVYMYFGVSKKFLGLYNAGSKGKFVWKQLIRKHVSYAKIR